MKLCAIEGEEGYDELMSMHDSGFWPRVTVNGRSVPVALRVDDERGVVEHYVRGADGRLSFDAFGRLQTDIAVGKVKIELVKRRDSRL